MKELNEFIEKNKRLLQKTIDAFNECDPNKDMELKRLEMNIERIDYYIRGLEEAKRLLREGMNK